MKKFTIILLVVCWTALSGAFSQTKISGYSYWFDNDPESAVAVAIPATESFELEATIQADALHMGLHLFNVQFRDDHSKHSTVLSQFFYKVPEQAYAVTNITEYEYWVDNDYASRVSQNIPAVQSFVVDESIELETLHHGLHLFNVRFRDNYGVWSTPLSHFFYKVPMQTVSNTELIAYEFWIDGDYANAVTESIMPSQQFILSQLIDLNGLSMGIHAITIRFKDNTNAWSSPLSQFVFKKRNTNNTVNEMVEYRYWFNDDEDVAVTGDFSPTASVVDLTGSLDMSQLWKGEHTVHFQFRDVYGEWSTVLSGTVTKTSLPVADFEFSAVLFCDSTTVETTNNSIDGEEYLWDFGDGFTSTEFEPAHTYAEPGDYSISLTVTDPAAGLDSTLVKPITVVSGSTFASLDMEACDEFTSPSGNYIWTTSGTYTDTIPNMAGCDSVISVNLAILASTYGMLTETVCDSYTSPSGIYTWSASGLYTDTIANTAGCDSVITIDLTVLPSTFAVIDEAGCGSYTSPSGLYTWTSSGLYYDTIPNVFGCDSLITINLSIIVVDTSVTQSGSTLTANAAGIGYQWVDCASGYSAISGATSQSFTPLESGDYAVVVYQEGCEDTSACYTVTLVNLMENTFESAISIFPNPTDGNVNVDLGSWFDDVHVQVIDHTGILTGDVKYDRARVIKLMLEGAPGIYHLRLTSGERRAVIRVVKK